MLKNNTFTLLLLFVDYFCKDVNSVSDFGDSDSDSGVGKRMWMSANYLLALLSFMKFYEISTHSHTFA